MDIPYSHPNKAFTGLIENADVPHGKCNTAGLVKIT